ncbi:MAG: 23S rRNA (guanosine(2251)-2'-O)-methyltransferase RlmB [bacterium]
MKEKQFDIIYGVNPVIEALQAKKRKPIKLYLADSRHDKYADMIRQFAKQTSIPLVIMPRQELYKITLSEGNQGIAGIFEPYPYSDIQTIIQKAKNLNEMPFLVALDQIQDPHNVGAIIRTASCLGWHGVILTKRRSPEITPAVVKASSGATEYMDIVIVANLRTEIELLKKDKCIAVGLDINGNSDFNDVTNQDGIVLIIGGEETGIRKPVLDVCDYIVSIPMKGKPNSLNASVSAGIAMYTLKKSIIQK